MKSGCVLVFSVLTVFICGCEPVPHYNDMRSAAIIGGLPKRHYGTVQLYENDSEVHQPYHLVALLSEEGSPGDEASMINAMLYKAADLGGDAVILGGPRLGGEDIKNNSVDVKLNAWAWIGNGDNRVYRGRVIIFNLPPGTNSPALPTVPH